MTAALGRLTVLAIFAFAVVSSPALGQSDDSARKPPNTLSIAGEGTFMTPPEIGEIQATVVTQGATVASARDPHPAAVAKVRAIIDGLANQGLKLKSASYSFTEDHPFENVSGVVSSKDRNKVVYQATTQFSLTTENLAGITDIVTALAASDLRIDNINFTVKDQRHDTLEARKEAARDALEQARAYADALDVDLVDIEQITDGQATPPDGEADLMALPANYRAPLSIVVPDNLTFTASVNIDWSIRMKSH